MGEISEKMARLSDTAIVHEFHSALVALYPTFCTLDCLEDDTQHYDDYDEVAAILWHVLVEKSLMWKYGLDAPPRLPAYGLAHGPVGTDGFVEVLTAQPAGKFRLVEFIGDRRFGREPFNAVNVLGKEDKMLTTAYPCCLEFNWVRG